MKVSRSDGFRRKPTQFSFGYSKPRNSTSQAEHEIGKHEDCRLINVFKAWKVDSDLSPKDAKVLRTARCAIHVGLPQGGLERLR